MNDIDLYKLSIIYLDKLLNDNWINHEEYTKCKNDFMNMYNIKDDVTVIW